MWVASYFPGDEDEALMWLQHDEYWKIAGWLFSNARTAFMDLKDKHDIDMGDLYRLERVQRFDHRVLQAAHDRIAAYYRYTVRNAQPIALAADAELYKAYRIAAWRNYYDFETRALAATTAFARAVVFAVLFENTPRGYESEDAAVALIDDRYGLEYRRLQADAEAAWAGREALQEARRKAGQLRVHRTVADLTMLFVFAKGHVSNQPAMSDSHDPVPIVCKHCGPMPFRVTLWHEGDSVRGAFSGRAYARCSNCATEQTLAKYAASRDASNHSNRLPLPASEEHPFCECGRDDFLLLICRPREPENSEEILVGQCAICGRVRMLFRRVNP